MKREIKFRVWIPENNRMIYPKPFVKGTKLEIEDVMLRPDGLLCWCPKSGEIHHLTNNYEVLLFTGLKDSKGKDIYEGDVVYLAGKGDYEVEWPFVELFQSEWEGDIGEIKGNIYENRELLK